jgi:hypothetical protein
MSTADIAIITVGVSNLAILGAGTAVVFKLARQLRVSVPPKAQKTDDPGSKS